ncbi:MAG: ABC transporter permease [Christensenellales bacterium]|jgi:ribose/xylose/arabinose/galactoside ABC-type transport system permease subunit
MEGRFSDSKGFVIKKVLRNNLTALTLVVVAMSVILSLTTEHFASPRNFTAILTQMSINGILAVGMTFCIIIAGVDLSVGNVLSLVGIVLAVCLRAGIPTAPAVILAILVGVVCGLINGLLISKGKLPAFIATLGMMSVAQGVALIICEGRAIYGMMTDLSFYGSGKIGFVPVAWIIMLICFGIAYFVFHHTRLGRYVYMIGGNEEAARLSGVSVTTYKTIAFTISGLCAGIGGVIMTARLNSADAVVGNNMQMDAIAAAIIGGTSMSGGEGKIIGTFLGSLIMSMIRNGMIQLGVGSYPQQVVIGLIIILVVLMDMLGKDKNR